MKKLIYAAGVLSLGGVHFAVQAAEGAPKPWSVSLTTQGFYDDNINTQPDGPGKIGSWGVFISPSVSYAQTWDQTTLNLGATYGAYWFADTQGTLSSDWNNTFNFNAGVNHTFNPRLSLEITDDFALFQNASQVLLGQTGRIDGNNFSNDAAANLSIELSSRWSLVTGYENVLFRYEEDQFAAPLDRIENYGRVDIRYLITPKTVGVVGTKVGHINYDSGLPFNPSLPTNPLFNPSTSIKDNMTYFAYGGFDHSFTPSLTGSLRAGAQIQDFNNYDSTVLGSDFDTQVNPYIDLSLSYAYATGSKAQMGIIHRANPTDVTGTFDTVNNLPVFEPTLQQVSTAFYANVAHAITSKLTGSVAATFQSSEFIGNGNGGLDGYNGQTEQWWSVGATLSYAVIRNLSLSVSYYYDLLNSDIPTRDYDRNRVFFGFTGTY
jgi:Putative beta-barrel porin 2